MEERVDKQDMDETVDQNTQEVHVEELGGEAGPTGEWKSVVTTEGLTSLGFIKKTKVSVRRLSCGHFVKGVDQLLVCSCGHTLCSECSQQAGRCENCGRALCRRCRRESLGDPNKWFCKRCRWFGWIRRIF